MGFNYKPMRWAGKGDGALKIDVILSIAQNDKEK
jgi:hypothetical protein